MPLRPVTGTLQLPVDTAEEVGALFRRGLSLAGETSRSRRQSLARDLEDHFYYAGTLRPALFRPLHAELVRLPDASREDFRFGFETWLNVLGGADDACVEALVSRLETDPEDELRLDLLAAIGTPPSLDAIARLVKSHPAVRATFERLGIAIERGGVRERFTRERRAVSVGPAVKSRAALRRCAHPIGLPVDEVMRADPRHVVKWHYVTFGLANVPGLPALPFERLHLVSPRSWCVWSLACAVDTDGRYSVESFVTDPQDDDEELDRLLDDADDGEGWAEAVLRPFDDELVYTNRHIHSTPRIVGSTGGPPLGLIEPPCRCPRCDRLAFHVAQVVNTIREYGDGFRSLFVCEECSIAISVACLWN